MHGLLLAVQRFGDLRDVRLVSDGGEVQLESGFPYRTIQALMDRGHKVTWANGPFGGYQAIRRDLKTGVYEGASESRKDGHAAGY